MLKASFVALAVVGAALVHANAESVVRRTDTQQPRTFDTFLPPVSPSVPWLNLDTKTRLPKGDYPIGRAVEVTPFVLRSPHIEHADLAEFALGGG